MTKDAEVILKKAMRAVQKKLPFRTDRQINEMLEFAADDMAHAYKIGAEEAQREILLRLSTCQIRSIPVAKIRNKPVDEAAEAARAEQFRISNENYFNEKAMIREMEASGLKVVRRDDTHCRAILIQPEVIHLESEGAHGYYPNAVKELYDKWKARKS